MAEIVAKLDDVARVVAYRLREDLKTVDPDSPTWFGLMENHAKDLDRLADKLAMQVRVDRKALVALLREHKAFERMPMSNKRLEIDLSNLADAVLALLSPEETK